MNQCVDPLTQGVGLAEEGKGELLPAAPSSVILLGPEMKQF